MADTGIFGVANVGAVSLEGFDHVAGFGDGNGRVRIAVEHPDGELRADFLGGFEIGNAVGIGLFAGIIWKKDATADGHDCSKLVGISCGERPAPVAAHGKSGEIGAFGITLEFFRGRGESGKRDLFHIRISPAMFLQALRHDDEGWETRAIVADGRGDADLGLYEAIGAAFAGAVEEEDNGPLLVGGPVVRHEDLIFVSGAVKRKAAVEETGFVFAGENGRAKSKNENEKQKKTEARDGHGDLQTTKCITSEWRAAKDGLLGGVIA
jgi:hypothetical protein